MNTPLAPGPEGAVDALYFQTFGFVVLRRAFDPRPLSAEIDRVIREGLASSTGDLGSGEIRFRYVPMMNAETPVSLALLDRFEGVATALLGGPVIPTRAKGVSYRGDTPWHADSVSPFASLGFAAYLEPLDVATGALRVLPGSHRPEMAEALRVLGAAGAPAASLPGYVVATEPGDVIVFDEHLFHASSGGGLRRQWRLDYLRDPVGAEAEEQVMTYFQGIYPPDWDGGYDVDRFASYGLDWQRSGRPAAERLAALGATDLAATQEAYTRSRR
ncbi:MAG: phytanoyl-CoA dioxygenase family protein [Minicystis sp.]